MGIVVIGTTFVDVKGHPHGKYVPAGRNAGRVIEVHGGVARNIAEDIANVGLAPAFVSVVDESGLSELGMDTREHIASTAKLMRRCHLRTESIQQEWQTYREFLYGRAIRSA